MAKNKNNTNNEVATIPNDVPQVLSLLQAELDKQKHIEESVYKTSGNFAPGLTNLKDETKVENLYKGLSIVLGKEHFYNLAIKTLKREHLQNHVFKHEGFTVEEWTADVELRIAIIENKERLDKLKEFKQRAEEFLSEQDKKAILFRDMAGFLSIGA